MNPDQWPKYKYLLLEIWQPANAVLKASVEEERNRCRGEVFSALHASFKSSYCREKMKLEEDLDKAELDGIFKQAVDAYNGLLRHIGAAILNNAAMKVASSNIPASAATQAQDSEI